MTENSAAHIQERAAFATRLLGIAIGTPLERGRVAASLGKRDAVVAAGQEDFVARERAEEIIRANPEWYHSIELAPGVVTPGRAPAEVWEEELRKLQLPDLHGKSVLDIGAYDGFFSFAAERLGASRVVALDYYVWSTDMAGYMTEWRKARQTSAQMPAPHESRYWRPDELPGRHPFDAAHALLGSKVETIVDEFMTMDPASLGRFDVVLFLGALYHLEEPLRAMRRVASVTAPGGLAVVETEAVEIYGLQDVALLEFFPGDELNDDATNWWAPNAKALEGLCKAAGFRDVSLRTSPPRLSPAMRLRAKVKRLRVRYRAIAHAREPSANMPALGL